MIWVRFSEGEKSQYSMHLCITSSGNFWQLLQWLSAALKKRGGLNLSVSIVVSCFSVTLRKRHEGILSPRLSCSVSRSCAVSWVKIRYQNSTQCRLSLEVRWRLPSLPAALRGGTRHMLRPCRWREILHWSTNQGDCLVYLLGNHHVLGPEQYLLTLQKVGSLLHSSTFFLHFHLPEME